jgi:hypothetical protein
MNVNAQTKTAYPDQHSARIVHNSDENPTATVFTYSRTPLQDAIRKINDEYGWAINYEDAPTVNAFEIVDDDPDFRQSHPNLKEGYFPNGQPFHSTFKESRTHHADVEAVLQQLLQDYNASSNPGRYTLKRTSQNGYVVVGTKYKSESGAEVEFTPPLSCPISVTISSMSLREAIQLVAKQVNSTCKANLSAEYAAQMLGQLGARDVSGTYDREPARDVIEELLLQEQGLVYYSVDYAPGINQFYLDTGLVYETITGVDGNLVPNPVLNKRVAGAGEHPF